MLGLFKGVEKYVRPKPTPVPRPDNFVFKLHYKVTFSILMVATILVSTYDYIDSSGSAIQCLFDKGTGIPNPVVNRYCWIMSTFTLPKHFKGTEGEDFLHYGVGKWILCYLTFICCIIRAPFTYLKINLSCSIPCLQKFFFSFEKVKQLTSLLLRNAREKFWPFVFFTDV